MGEHDVAVVGAGIVGLAVAYELRRRRPGLRVVVVDKEQSVGAHQTGHNSGVIHAGIYYEPGSLKARLCVEGARRMYRFCEEHDVPFERCGKLIVARHEGELPGLAELERRGRANGVEGLRRLGATEIPEVEPNAVGVAAVHSPATGIVDYGLVARRLADVLRAEGVAFALGAPVTSIRREGATSVLVRAQDRVRARWVISCAGLWSDVLARAAGADADPRIVPFRGAYLQVRDDVARDLVRGMVYPVPDPALPFLGVHITRRAGGGVLLGPTALLVGAREGYRLSTVRRKDAGLTLRWPGTWRMAARYWRTGLSELRMAASRDAFVRACAEYVPALEPSAVVRQATAGVRAQAVGRDGSLVDDFVLSGTPGATHVRNAPSPAATSAFALAEELVDRAARASGAPELQRT